METLKETNYRTYTVQIPTEDLKLFRMICKRMGWKYKLIKQKRQ